MILEEVANVLRSLVVSKLEVNVNRSKGAVRPSLGFMRCCNACIGSDHTQYSLRFQATRSWYDTGVVTSDNVSISSHCISES